MASLPVKISKKTSKIFKVEIDASRLERLAEVFGFYNPACLKEIDQAERDIRTGRVRTIKSFRDLDR